MSLGIIMLVHTAFERAEQIARHWHAGGCPVVIHVDSKVPDETFTQFQSRLSELENIRFSKRHHCEWGMWGLVAATQRAAELMLQDFPQAQHILLTSGACLPLRQVSDLREFLDKHPDTDFIESVSVSEVRWNVGGLGTERFRYYFPLSWRRKRSLFDTLVSMQRFFDIRRRIPEGIKPHLGSQWWCLSQNTLRAILEDSQRLEYDRYFRYTWIPDESYFQTLARKHGRKIESRSLTLAKFDFQGRPYMFYDDHLPLLRRSDCFVARKIWTKADRLYDEFLNNPDIMKGVTPNPARIDRVFAQAIERRRRGRPGLYMQSRFPVPGREIHHTAGPYTIFEGFADVLEDLEAWLEKYTSMQVHGHLFGPERAEFSNNAQIVNGGLSDSAKLRDYNPKAFLTNLIWNMRGVHQCFQFGPADSQDIMDMIRFDANASIFILTGAWILPLLRSDLSDDEKRQKAALFQQVESKHLAKLRGTDTKASVKIWSMSDFIETPTEIMRSIAQDLGIPLGANIADMPHLKSIEGVPEFLQKLKNQGTAIYLPGDFWVSAIELSSEKTNERYYTP